MVRPRFKRSPLPRLALTAASAVVVFAAGVVTHSATAQTTCMTQRVEHPSPWPFNTFGAAVDICGTTAVISATGPDEVYVYEHDGDQWVSQQVLTGAADDFGRDVAIDGDVIIVGAREAAFVFERQRNEWVERQTLLPDDPDDLPVFGRTVAIHGDVIAVSSFAADAAWVYRRAGNTWDFEQKLMSSEPGQFGTPDGLAVYGNMLAGGAPIHGPGDPDLPEGAVFIFVYDGQKWLETQMIKSPLPIPPGGPNPVFGRALDMHGDLLVIGDHWAWKGEGRAFIYRPARKPGQWEFVQLIEPPDADLPPSNFARTIAVDGERALVGHTHSTGRAILYEPLTDENGVITMQHTATMEPLPNEWINGFAQALAMDRDWALVGAFGEDFQSGAAYFFDLDPPPGDLDCDGVVTGEDLAILLANWGPCADCDLPANCPANLNDDCTVDGADLAILLSNWG